MGARGRAPRREQRVENKGKTPTARERSMGVASPTGAANDHTFLSPGARILIDEVDAELMRWIQGVVGDVSVQFEPPTKLSAASDATVSVYLTEIVRDPALRD